MKTPLSSQGGIRSKYDSEERMLFLLENRDLDYFADEWVVSKLETAKAFDAMCEEVKTFAYKCKYAPLAVRIHYEELLFAKKKILRDLIKNFSLLNSDPI